MPNRWIKGAAAVILACCLAQGGLITAMAATKPIKSVSVRVNSKLEAGSTLPGIDIGTGTPEKGKVMVSGRSFLCYSRCYQAKFAATGY